MTDSNAPTDPHPGMLGDGTEEQNLNQPGDPSQRIGEDEVDEDFGEGDTPAEDDLDDEDAEDDEESEAGADTI